MPDPFYPRGEREWKPSDEPTPMLLRAADALYEQCRRAIMAHRLDARSPIGDAVLDYRQERDEAAARSTDKGLSRDHGSSGLDGHGGNGHAQPGRLAERGSGRYCCQSQPTPSSSL